VFFYDLLLGSIICLFCVFIYTFYLYSLKDKRYCKLFFSILILSMTGLLLCYTNSSVSLVFLDIPIILGYLKKYGRESVLLSVLLTILLMNVGDINPYIFLMKYIVYGISYLIFRKKNYLFDILIGVKTFFITIIAFGYYYMNASIMLLSLLAVSIFIYYLILIIVKLLNLKSSDYSLEKLEMEKRIFKITHEIKNPIAVCKGYLDMLDTRDTKKVEKYIPIIKSEMNRAITIMDDFLSISNISIRREILDIYMLIEDVRDTMGQLLKENKVKLDIPKFMDELYLVGDYDRLKQVFINMIKNAYEAHASNVKITTKVTKSKLKIEIIDDGDGINSKDLKRIGDIFYTTKIKGTGIGVNFSKEVISLHNGEINYQSELGKGTTVMIILPIEKGIN